MALLPILCDNLERPAYVRRQAADHTRPRNTGLPPHPRSPLNENPRPQAFREVQRTTNPKGFLRICTRARRTFGYTICLYNWFVIWFWLVFRSPTRPLDKPNRLYNWFGFGFGLRSPTRPQHLPNRLYNWFGVGLGLVS